MSVARDLARLVVETPDGEITPRAFEYAAMLVSSTVASAAMGSTLRSAKITLDYELSRGGPQESSIWFGGHPKLPMAAAARVNAVRSDGAASDDSDLRNISHPGTGIVTAAIAAAEKAGASGRDVLAAIVLGYDVAARINGAVTPGLIWENGFHGCMIAIAGGAAAAARLLKLNVDQATHALAMSAITIGGLRTPASVSIAREYYAGNAAKGAIEVVQLAQLGYEVSEIAFEQPGGFFDIYGQDARKSGRADAATQGLGQSWQILEHMALKLVPGGHPFHSIAEAAAQASRAANVPPEDIASITISRPDMYRMYGSSNPTDLVGIAHSHVYFAAAAAADRDFTWAHASPEKIMDPRIRRLFELVQLDRTMPEDAERYLLGSTVTLQLRDGRRFASTVYAPRGCAAVGIEWSDVETKFRTLCPFSGMSGKAIERASGMIRTLKDAPNVRELLDAIRADEPGRR